MKMENLFIGTKLIAATPMKLGAYNEYRGWEIPEDEDPDTDGYLVEYMDGGRSNHKDHEGYISWSPKPVFDMAYRPTNGMNFGLAIEAMKAGLLVRRKGWNGEGMFCYFVDGSTFEVNRPPLQGIYKDGTVITYRPHIDMRTADGSCVPWLASQSDILADDWVVVS